MRMLEQRDLEGLVIDGLEQTLPEAVWRGDSHSLQYVQDVKNRRSDLQPIEGEK